MDDKTSTLETQRLIKEYVFLLSDEEYKSEIIEENKNIFLQKINEKKTNLGIKDIQEINEQTNLNLINKKKEIQNNKSVSKNKNIKKIFREIVKKTHPDKNPSKENLEKYLDAKESYENGDFIKLYLVATDLNIKFKLEIEDINLIKINIEQKKKYLSNIEQSYLWVWLNAKTELEKDNIITVFINNTTKK